METISKNTLAPVLGCLLTMLLVAACAGWRVAWAADTTDRPNDDSTFAAATLSTGDQTADDETLNTGANLNQGIAYSAKLVGKDWQAWKGNGETAGSAGKSRRLEALAIKLGENVEGSVQYQVHLAGAGWQKPHADSTVAGRAGKGRAIDGIRIALTGKISKTHKVMYRVNLVGTGWQSWKNNGNVAGKNSAKHPVRAMQVKLVKKKATGSKTTGSGIVGVRYSVNMKGSGWSTWAANNERAGKVSKHQRLKGLRIFLDPGRFSGSIHYSLRTANETWRGWRSDGKATGLYGNVEALRIQLMGEIAKRYDVMYRVYVQGIGWQRRMRNGETAGTWGKHLRIESLQVSLVPKTKVSGWVYDKGAWAYYKAGKQQKNTWIVTKEHPIDLSASGTQRYWIDSKGMLAISRYVNPRKARDSKAGYTAYATPEGYVARGKYANDDGLLLARNNGQLYTKTRWLTTSRFDGTKQRYRLVKNGACALVQTGLFEVNGKKYFAWEDGRGYLVCSTSKWIDKKWYVANAKGVLQESNSDLIERYVSWALGIANDDSHGYSQKRRWGPDYDCSSFVCAALLKAGLPDSGALWTGNMKSCLRRIGFVWHRGTGGIQWGDIMLVHNDMRQHTEIYLGDGYLVGAHSSETGGIDGRSGDQTGGEISVTPYYNAPWQGYLRFNG